jgi:putative flippase GtrA
MKSLTGASVSQAARYGVVGVLAFAVDYGVTWLLVQHIPLLAANTIGFLAANGANFLMAHQWVFGHEWKREKLLSTYLATLGISVVGLILNNAVVWFAVGLVALPLLLGKVLAAGVVMVWNYAARVFLVYGNNDKNQKG